MFSRRNVLTGGAAAVGALVLNGRAPAIAQSAARTIRFVPQNNLTELDPIASLPVYVTRDHGYMIFDTLYALDANYQVRPQMAEGHEMSSDGKQWRVRLRDGLKFHDGEPVRAADCVASLIRWSKRDSLGGSLFAAVEEIKTDDDRTFSVRLKHPFPLFLEVLGKCAAPIPFIMPERLAKTPPTVRITELIGSGPFRWAASEWQPDLRAVYLKNNDYVPRQDAPSWGAGGKVVKVDRVEWHMIPDSGTSVAGLQSGEIDWIDDVDPGLAPVIEGSGKAKMVTRNPLGMIYMMAVNHIQPPFNNPRIRQALLMGIKQANFAVGTMGPDEKYWDVCRSFFTCGTPMSSEAGNDLLRVEDPARAAAALKEAGYAGEKVIVLQAADLASNRTVAAIAAEAMKNMGMNVELATSDWATVMARRAKKEPGVWNCYFGAAPGPDLLDPAVNFFIRANGMKNLRPGWADDQRLEAARSEWILTSDPAKRKALAETIQRYAFETLPYVPLFRLYKPSAIANSLKDVLKGPATNFWSVSKA